MFYSSACFFIGRFAELYLLYTPQRNPNALDITNKAAEKICHMSLHTYVREQISLQICTCKVKKKKSFQNDLSSYLSQYREEIPPPLLTGSPATQADFIRIL